MQHTSTDPFAQYRNFYLVGIKGVAMTSITQILVDLGKNIRGSDVAETFVTQKILDTLAITIDTHFSAQVPQETDCLIYTAAHNGVENPQVQLKQLEYFLTLKKELQSVGLEENQQLVPCSLGFFINLKKNQAFQLELAALLEWKKQELGTKKVTASLQKQMSM